MTPAKRIEAEQFARRYGSANCWTGTSGTLAAWLLLALREIDRLKEESDERLLPGRRGGAAAVSQDRPADQQGRGV
jgi:hypothetical protein